MFFISPNEDLSEDQVNKLESMKKRSENIFIEFGSEPSHIAYMDRFYVELDRDMTALKEIYPDGGQEYLRKREWLLLSWASQSEKFAELDSGVLAETLRTLYGAGGIMEPYINDVEVGPSSKAAKILAPYYHLVMNDPDRYGVWIEKLKKSVALAMVGFDDSARLIDELKKLQQQFGGETHIDCLPEMAKQGIEGLSDNPYLISKVGGVSALTSAGADLNKMISGFLTLLNSGLDSLLQYNAAYSLIIYSYSQLFDNGLISEDQKHQYKHKLAKTCLSNLEKSRINTGYPKSIDTFWRDNLRKMVTTLSASDFETLNSVVLLMRHCNPDQKWLDINDLTSKFDRDEVKARFAEKLPGDKIYDVAKKLGILHYYSDNEKLQMLGGKFSSELGL